MVTIKHKYFLGHCYAIGGEGIGRDCIFPFIGIDQKSYSSCAKMQPSGIPWCETEAKAATTNVTGKWGYCNPGCT